MPYIGKQPLTGAYQLCDAIVTSATATYNLLVGGSAVIPGSANNCIVSLNGVVQAPVSAFTVSGSTITFASTLSATDVIDFILILGNVFDIGTPTNGAVTNSSLNSNVITGQTAETSIAGGDLVLLYDDSASALRKMTRANFTKGTPTIQRFTSSSGTYTTPSGVTYIIVEMSGAGGGGSGGGTGSWGAGGNGGNTTFGTSLHTASGGTGGPAPWSGGGGAGGSVTLGSGGTQIYNSAGTAGGGSGVAPDLFDFALTGMGGQNLLGGGAPSVTYIGGGAAGITNSGGGGSGGGGGTSNAAYTGTGGGAGGYMRFLISSPSATYAYAIGAAGTAGTAGSGSSAAAGGAGGSGVIIVTEYYS